MKRLILAGFIALIVSYSSPSFADSDTEQRMDPSKHVRIVYNQFNTPDSMVFMTLLDRIQALSQTLSEQELEDIVFSEMNLTWDQELEAWITVQPDTIRHSREETRDFLNLLISVTNDSFDAQINRQRELFCPSDKFHTSGEKLSALESWTEIKHSYNDSYFNYVMREIDEQTRADLLAWISRIKKNFRGEEYNTRALWAGHESKVDARLGSICRALGAK